MKFDIYMEKIIVFMGEKAKVACDEKCNKAFGLNSRPIVIVNNNEFYLSDSDLDNAPANPSTYAGSHGKPIDKLDMLNKWCVNECERCVMSDLGKLHEPLELPDFNNRVLV